MTEPSDIIYDLLIERPSAGPIRVFIKFLGKSKRQIIGLKDALTNEDLENCPDLPTIENAIDLLKWAIDHDPDPPAPEIANFIRSI